ncbi:serine hydrolase domain-containing protein [Jiulongibacter sediminis]|uniref:Beta-lactamase-related domain-containing protein n=1 Tax=Jiulongibacter sediminis TaxID=1605367 RepID=A0A0P7BYV7_9BACT|nr:serine hydrolase domain-containing protein [Jiulongibacter sediminis]KPM46759.1 hypothetical protein AFM12_18545 [Jiulongibacter sediminis]TBX21663.1 hypothetical protein TK44_18550 [Jiulongibacter sediminis]
MMKNILLVFLFFNGLMACQPEIDLETNSLEELQQKIQGEAERNGLSSVAYSLVRNEEILISSAWGFADKENKVPATDQTRYLLASVSKTITAVAIMQLVEQKRIHLDDDIMAYLPFPLRNPKFPDSKITYRMLLSHMSSISDRYQSGLDLYCYGTDCPMTLETFFEETFTENGLYYSKNNFSNIEPGTAEDYSNLGSALLGYLVQRITQMPFDEYCKQHIFEVLSMSKTEWRLAKTPLNELAIPYSSETNRANPHYTFPDYPNGGLRSSLHDLSIFLRAIIQDGTFQGHQILSASSMAEMKKFQFGSTEQCLSFYYETINGKKYLGHSGGEMGVTTEMYFDRDTGLGVVLLCNDEDADLENIMALLFHYGEK